MTFAIANDLTVAMLRRGSGEGGFLFEIVLSALKYCRYIQENRWYRRFELQCGDSKCYYSNQETN